jgi:hypothetical protein
MSILGFDLRMPLNRLPGIIQNYRPAGGRNQGRPLKRLLLCETITVQPVAELHDGYIIIINIIIISEIAYSVY